MNKSSTLIFVRGNTQEEDLSLHTIYLMARLASLSQFQTKFQIS